MGPSLRQNPEAGRTASVLGKQVTSTGIYESLFTVQRSMAPLGRQKAVRGIIGARLVGGLGTKSCFWVVIAYIGPSKRSPFSMGRMGGVRSVQFG